MPKRTPAVSKGERVPSNSITEVAEFMDAKEDLDTFKATHADVFREYADLVEKYNDTLEKAEKAVKARGVSCGPIVNIGVRTSYNWEKAHEELGEELFLEFGGSVNMVAHYDGDEAEMDRAIASNKVPKECVPHFRVVTRTYRKLPKLAV